MKIKIVAVGKIKEQYFKSAISEYEKRLSAYTNIEIIEVSDEPIAKNSNPTLDQQIKEKEGSKILSTIKDNEYVILLDLHKVNEYDSISFANHLDKLFTNGKSTITFVIGGSLGLGENIRQRANERIILSKFTFTHQMVRILILEQIYRAFKINSHETYHK